MTSGSTSEDTVPMVKRTRDEENINEQGMVNSIGGGVEEDLLKQVIENQKTNRALLERVINNQADLEANFEGLLSRLEDIVRLLFSRVFNDSEFHSSFLF